MNLGGGVLPRDSHLINLSLQVVDLLLLDLVLLLELVAVVLKVVFTIQYVLQRGKLSRASSSHICGIGQDLLLHQLILHLQLLNLLL
jgi:hypothetical protein